MGFKWSERSSMGCFEQIVNYIKGIIMRTRIAGISEFIKHQIAQFKQGISVGLVLILMSLTMQAQEIDLLLKGGHLIDPKNNIDSKMDVAIVADKIFRIAKDIPANTSKKTVDISGLYITPGLIDMHAHVFHGTDPNSMTANSYGGLQPDAFSFRAGVTTLVDAGSSGWRNFPLFKTQTIDRAQTRVLAFLNVVGNGMLSRFDQQDVTDMNPEMNAYMIKKLHPNIIVGINRVNLPMFRLSLILENIHLPIQLNLYSWNISGRVTFLRTRFQKLTEVVNLSWMKSRGR